MRRARRHGPRLVPLLAALAFTACSTGPQLHTSPLQLPTADIALVAPGGGPVTVAVQDRRPATELGSGFLGPKGEQHEGIYFGYVAAAEDEVARFVEGAAKEALAAFGVPPGSGARLEIVVEEFRVDLHRWSGFTPMNCVGYGRLRTRFLEGDRETGGGVFRLTYYENTSPAMSMKEVTREAISRIWAQAAWEATARTLAAARGLKADPARVTAILDRMATEKSELVRRRLVFWLGLSGAATPPVAEALEAVIRTSKEPRHRQGAVEAAGMLGLGSMKPLLEKLLVEKVGDWNPSDTEQTWYVLKALHALGEKDLVARIPKGPMKMKTRLEQLAAYLASGEMPPLAGADVQGLEAARRNRKK